LLLWLTHHVANNQLMLTEGLTLDAFLTAPEKVSRHSTVDHLIQEQSSCN